MSNKSSISYVEFRDSIMEQAEYIKGLSDGAEHDKEREFGLLRALFTGFCYAFEVWPDTHECDWLLYDIHGKVLNASEKYREEADFEEFMLKYLV